MNFSNCIISKLLNNSFLLFLLSLGQQLDAALPLSHGVNQLLGLGHLPPAAGVGDPVFLDDVGHLPEGKYTVRQLHHILLQGVVTFSPCASHGTCAP